MMPRSLETRMFLPCMLLALSLLCGPAAAEAPARSAEVDAETGGLYVSVEGGLLSVRLEDASLVAVMEELSRKSGMRIKLDRGASKQISLTFRNMPFDRGIRNLIRPLGYAMVWRKTRDEDGNELEILEELHIFREGHQGGAVVELRPPEPVEEEAEEPRPVTKRVWDDETRQRMLEKMRVVPSEP